MHHNLLINLIGFNHPDSAVQQDISLSLMHQTTLGLGSLFLPDINTTLATLAFSSQVDSTILSSNLLGWQGEISPGFHFQAPLNVVDPGILKQGKGLLKVQQWGWKEDK